MKSGLREQKSRFGSEPRFRDQLRRRSDLDLKINTRRNVFSYPVIFCLFCFVTPLYRDFPQLFWPALAGVIFTTVSRQAIVLSYDRLYPENPKLWRRLLESGILLGAAIWGGISLSLLVFYDVSWLAMFFLFMTGGITSGATSAFSPRACLAAVFITIILGPVVIWGIVQARPETVSLSVAVCFYLLMMIIFSRSHHTRYTEGVAKDYALQKAHDELERRVRERTAELDAANTVLRQSEQRYNALFSGINDAVLVHYLPMQGRSGKFIDMNDVACHMLGYSHRELQGMGMADIVAPDSPVTADHALEKLTVRQDYIFEQKLLTREHRGVLVEIHARRFDFKGRQAVLYAARDITDRKEAEKMMIQAEKIMSVGGLATGLVHEINNPLAGILQTSQVIENRIKKPLPPNLRAARETGIRFEQVRTYMEKRNIYAMLDANYEAAKRAAEIINNMLSFARKSASYFTPESLPELMDRTIDIAENDYNLKKKFDFRNISITREYQPDLPLAACRPGEIQQVFFNILSNGAHAMMDMGRTVQPRFLIRITKQGECARIEIRDNGPGMPDGVRENAFQAFYTTKPEGKGTGLGLYVSDMIVRKNHNGAIRIESGSTGGTAFIIDLPFREK